MVRNDSKKDSDLIEVILYIFLNVFETSSENILKRASVKDIRSIGVSEAVT